MPADLNRKNLRHDSLNLLTVVALRIDEIEQLVKTKKFHKVEAELVETQKVVGLFKKFLLDHGV